MNDASGLRVVMIAPTPFFSDRGCHVRILEETRALVRAGATVTVCTYFLGDSPAGVAVQRTGSLPGYRKRTAGPAWGKLALDAMLLRLARRVVREEGPHVLHGHLHEGIAVARRVPGRFLRVLDVQGSLTDETLDHRFLPDVPAARRPLEWLEGRLDRSADLILTSHRGAAREVVDRFGAAPARVRVVGDGGTLPAARADVTAAYRERWGLAPGDPVVLYTGLLGEHQGTPHLFAVAQALADAAPRAKLLVLGYPESRWRLEADRRGLSARMIFGGRFPYPDYASLLALGTVAVSPKTSLTEGNQKLYAYLEAGLPVVAFDSPASREILADAGALVPLDDGAALGRQIKALLADPAGSARLSEASRARAAALGGWDAVAARVLDAYRAAGAVW